MKLSKKWEAAKIKTIDNADRKLAAGNYGALMIGLMFAREEVEERPFMATIKSKNWREVRRFNEWRMRFYQSVIPIDKAIAWQQERLEAGRKAW